MTPSNLTMNRERITHCSGSTLAGKLIFIVFIVGVYEEPYTIGLR